MSLIDFFFNASSREPVSYSKETIKENAEQKQKRNKKFWNDFHLKKMQHEVSLLNSEIIYGFIKVEDITEDKFKLFLESKSAAKWVIPILWTSFKKQHNL